MTDVWRKAEQDLGIDIDLKAAVGLKNGTKTFVLIKDFGGPKGIIVSSIDDTQDFKELQELGFYCSALGDSYTSYDRVLFIDTLNDWGFFGEAKNRPTWYEGKSWT